MHFDAKCFTPGAVLFTGEKSETHSLAPVNTPRIVVLCQTPTSFHLASHTIEPLFAQSKEILFAFLYFTAGTHYIQA
jgi:hypothetical protein